MRQVLIKGHPSLIDTFLPCMLCYAQFHHLKYLVLPGMRENINCFSFFQDPVLRVLQSVGRLKYCRVREQSGLLLLCKLWNRVTWSLHRVSHSYDRGAKLKNSAMENEYQWAGGLAFTRTCYFSHLLILWILLHVRGCWNLGDCLSEFTVLMDYTKIWISMNYNWYKARRYVCVLYLYYTRGIWFFFLHPVKPFPGRKIS